MVRIVEDCSNITISNIGRIDFIYDNKICAVEVNFVPRSEIQSEVGLKTSNIFRTTCCIVCKCAAFNNDGIFQNDVSSKLDCRVGFISCNNLTRIRELINVQRINSVKIFTINGEHLIFKEVTFNLINVKSIRVGDSIYQICSCTRRCTNNQRTCRYSLSTCQFQNANHLNIHDVHLISVVGITKGGVWIADMLQ